MPETGEYLRCPLCQSGIRPAAEADRLQCASCSATFPVWNGIPILAADPDYFFGETSRDVFLRLLSEAQKSGSQRALMGLYREGVIDDYVVRYGFGVHRGAFLPLLNPGPDRRVLDLGCGWGEISLALASVFGECYSLDLTKERVAFVQLRAREMGLANVHPICAGDRKLPLPEQFLDCVVLNGVLEWVPEGREGDPYLCQLHFLKDVSRVLKPGGILYIAIENRFAAAYFRGSREDHTGLLYTSIMPRSLANFVSIRQRGRPYRTYTYSRTGYVSLLNRAGFSRPRVFLPQPDYREFRVILDSDSPASVLEFASGDRKRGYKAILKSRLLPRLSHSFALVAANGGSTPPQTWIDRFGGHIGQKTGQASAAFQSRLEVSRIGAIRLILRWNSHGILAKIPASPAPEIDAGLQREFRFLRELMGSCDEASGFEFPTPLDAGSFEGVRYYAQGYLRSADPGAATREARRLAMEGFLRWSAGRAREGGESEIEWRVDRFSESCDSVGLVISTAEREQFAGVLRRAGNMRVPCHGDLWEGNMIAGVRYPALIDWADSHLSGFPAHDLFHFHLFDSDRRGDHWERMLACAVNGFPDECVTRLRGSLDILARSDSRLVFTPDQLGALFLLYVEEHLSRIARRSPFSRFMRPALARLIDAMSTQLSLDFARMASTCDNRALTAPESRPFS